MASRLEQEASPGGILVSYDTYAQVKGEVNCEAAGEIKLRGIAYPVATYRVVDLHDGVSPDDTSIHADLPHLKIHADVGAMDDEERSRAEEVLSKALRDLTMEPRDRP